MLGKVLEVELPFGGDKFAPFLFTFQWTPGVVLLSAQLWTTPWYDDIPASLYPYHDTLMQLDPWTVRLRYWNRACLS